MIVNADDFGFTRDVNEGIIAAHRDGILTAATLMANGAAFDHAVGLARQTPSLDIGCHLVLVGGSSLLTGHPFPASVPQLLVEIGLGRMAIYDELAAQVRQILLARVAPSHLDTHKHTHLAPRVFDAVVRIARDFQIPWVRKPFDFSAVPGTPFATRVANYGMGLMRGRFNRSLAGLRMSDHFAGFQLTGHLRTENLVRTLRGLPDGLTEFMCHPGYCGVELQAAPTRLRASRAVELTALTSVAAREALLEKKARLVNYREL